MNLNKINNFSEIPSFVEEAFGTYQNVVLVLVDGMGWKFFPKGKKLKTQFPSTTTVCVTTLFTGLPLADHGMPEWQYYDATVDDLIKPLLFSFANTKDKNTLKGIVNPKDIVFNGNWSDKLKEKGIKTWVVQNQLYTPGGIFTTTAGNGFEQIPWKNFKNGFKLVDKILRENSKTKNYIYYYYDVFDAVLHDHGSKSKFTRNELNKIKRNVDIFLNKTAKYRQNTLFILTADHGQIDVDPEKTYYLNLEIPELWAMIKENKNGKKMVIGGSARCVFLYIKPECLRNAYRLLKDKLKSIAEVFYSSDQIKLNINKERIGDILILPKDNKTIWWYEKDVYEMKHKGLHGGKSLEEIEIPFLTQELK
jgi:predicted AlkP superfamily pyrophosphatase or phosphodiesterase